MSISVTDTTPTWCTTRLCTAMRRTSGEVKVTFLLSKYLLLFWSLRRLQLSESEASFYPRQGLLLDHGFYPRCGKKSNFHYLDGLYKRETMFRNNSGDLIICDILDWVECCTRTCDARGDNHAQLLYNFQRIQIKSPGKSLNKTYIFTSVRQ